MTRLLENKNAVITGCNRGIGFATLKLFAEKGCNVWACVRCENKEFEKKAETIAKENNVWIKPVYFDLGNSEEIKAGIKQIRENKEKIDILVNNAGIEQQGGFFQMTPMAVFEKIFKINVFAQIEFSQYITKLMMRHKAGSVINLSSCAGIDMTGGYMAYSASKAAIISVTKTMASELINYGIRVNAIAPGIVETQMSRGLTDEARENTKNSSLMNRIGEPEEIAEAIAFLASDASSYMTGQVLRVDGGM